MGFRVQGGVAGNQLSVIRVGNSSSTLTPALSPREREKRGPATGWRSEQSREVTAQSREVMVCDFGAPCQRRVDRGGLEGCHLRRGFGDGGTWQRKMGLFEPRRGTKGAKFWI